MPFAFPDASATLGGRTAARAAVAGATGVSLLVGKPALSPDMRAPRRVAGRWRVPDSAGPDQRVAGLVVLHLDEAGVDRGGKARIVELDREVVAAGLLGLLLPRGAELGVAAGREDPVVGRLLVFLLRSDEPRLTLRVSVLIVPVKPFSLLVKVPMVAMSKSPSDLPGPPNAASMAIKRPGGDRPAPLAAKVQRRMAGNDYFAARGMAPLPGSPSRLRHGVARQGKIVGDRRCGKAIGARARTSWPDPPSERT